MLHAYGFLPLVCAMSVSSLDQHLSVVSLPIHSILDAMVLGEESAVLLPRVDITRMTL